MAHQVHALPWATLCSNFRYRKARSGPGPQYADLYPREDKSDLLKSVEHFARSFQTNVRLHAETHRRKHYTSEQYARRARSWTTPAQEMRSEASSTEPTQTHQDSEDLSPDEIRRQRNLDLRSLQASLLQDWSLRPETRDVYPDYFHSSYSLHMYRPLAKDLQSVDHWPAVPDPQPAIWSSWPRALFEQCEVVKTLFIAAADLPAEAESQRDHLIDTLFLLVHRPETLFHRYDGLGLSCCYFETGLDGFIKRIARCYVYLNMLFVYHEQAGSPSSLPSEQRVIQSDPTTKRSRNDAASQAATSMFTYHTTPDPCYDTDGRTSSGLCRDATPLSPWPAYARLQTYRTLTYSCCHRHEYMAEAALFVPFFFPFGSDSDPELGLVEADILADLERLKMFVKKLWRVLVIYEMINNDRGLIEVQERNDEQHSKMRRQPRVNWEYVVLDGISCTWAWRESKIIFGVDFHDYIDQRRAEDPIRGFWLRDNS